MLIWQILIVRANELWLNLVVLVHVHKERVIVVVDCLEKLKVLLVSTDTSLFSRDIELGIGRRVWELRLFDEL